MQSNIKVREPAAAGRFYPDDQGQLQAMLDDFRPTLPPGARDSSRTRAIIVPHAGYKYSGKTAANAFSRLSPDYCKRAIVIGPSHHVSFHGISIAPFDQYRTPLGCVDIDMTECHRILHTGGVFLQREDVHRYEHAIEVELPFLQDTIPGCRLVPLVVGELSWDEVDAVAEKLVDSWNEDTVIVVSSDFTHYGRAFDYCPFSIRDAAIELEKLDRGAISLILEAKTDGFLKYVENTGATICGRLPIAILLAMIAKSEEDVAVELLSYTNSGEVLKNYEQAVGYAAINIASREIAEQSQGTIELTESDKQTLLQCAYQSISVQIAGDFYEIPDGLPTRLYNIGSVFVTLTIDGQLRGCIGSIRGKEPIIESVVNNAGKAAFSDPRFPPLLASELNNLTLEISYLSTPKPIGSTDEIKIGEHGVILDRGNNHAVFLPQVAIEHCWDLRATLENLSRKAGLSASAWRSGNCSFSVFESVRFSATARQIMESVP